MCRRLWPCRPWFLPGEAFSSWFFRLAIANNGAVDRFALAAFPGMAILNRDLDKFAPTPLLQGLADKSGRSVDAMEGACLRRYVGILYEGVSQAGPQRWALRQGVYNRQRTGFGHQWCAACLRSDPVPYSRLVHRLALVSTCPTHGVVLVDRCHGCGEPSLPHKATRNKPTHCDRCDADRREAPQSAGSSRTLQLEARLVAMLDDPLPHTFVETLHPLAYYGLVHQVLASLVRGSLCQELRAAAASRFGGDARPPVYSSGERTFESLSANDRHRLMELAAPLLDAWPWHFVAACSQAGISRTHLYGFQRPRQTPYVFARPVADYLSTNVLRPVVGVPRPQDGLAFHGQASLSAARRKAKRQALRSRGTTDPCATTPPAAFKPPCG